MSPRNSDQREAVASLDKRATPAAIPTNPPVILVVDDDADLRELACMALEDAGMGAAQAGDGAEALVFIRGGAHVDCVLLDMRMPVMDGWEFARCYRETVDEPRAPIIVFTAAHDAAHRARQINADGYVPKPCDLDDLVRKVRLHAYRSKGTLGQGAGAPA